MRILPRSLKTSVALTLLTLVGASPASQPATRPAGGGPETLDGVLLNFRLPIDVRATTASAAEAVQAVRDRCRVRIDVDWSALHAIGVERDSPVRVRLRDVKVSKALHFIFYGNGEADDDRRVYLIPSGDGRSVVVTNLVGIKATAVDHDYPIGDLIHPVNRNPPAPPGPSSPLFASGSVDQAPAVDPKEELLRYVEQNLDTYSWEGAGGKIGQVTIDGDHATLHVHQTPANQRKVEAALANFRGHKRAMEAADERFTEKVRATNERATRP